MLNKKIKEIFSYIKKHKWELIILLLILSLAFALRIYKISDYMIFLGDEGRDATIVRRLLVDKDLIFVGPGTSVGNMYLGPLYYYMMAPALLLANYSPVGPSIMIAIIGVVSIFLLWKVTYEWFGIHVAIIVSLLYTLSPVVIIYSRFSWNPNIMPFFSLLMIYSLWNVWHKGKWGYLLILGLSFSAMLQSHYLGLTLLPFILFFIFSSFIRHLRSKNIIKGVLSLSAGMILFLVFISPIILFDAKYDWRNIKAMVELFSGSGGVSFNPIDFLSKIPQVYILMNQRLLTAMNKGFGIWLTYFILFAFGIILIFLREKYDRKKYDLYYFLFSLLAISLIGLSFYRFEIYDHYMGFVFYLPFIIFGLILDRFTDIFKKYKLPVFYFIGAFVLIPNIINSPVLESPNKQLQKSRNISEKIRQESLGEKFNMAVLAEKNYEGAYQYYLELWNLPISYIDPQRHDETVGKYLFVVCEFPDKEICHPTSNPKTEVANFGWSKVDDYWDLEGVRLFRLVHNVPER